MQMSAMLTTAQKSLGRHGRGEALQVWAACAVLAAVVATAGAFGSALVPLIRQSTVVSAERELESAGRLITQMIGQSLPEERHGEVRETLTALTQQDDLLYASIVLSDGKTLVRSLTRLADVDAPADVQEVIVRLPLTVQPHGQVMLEMATHVDAGAWFAWQAGSAAMLVFGLGGCIVAFTNVRRRARVYRAVGDALLSMNNGEEMCDALKVDTRFGEEAEAWNGMLEEREQLRRELLRERARDSLHNRSEGRGDLGQACDALWQGMLLVDETLNVKYANGAAAVFLRTKRETMSTPSETGIAAFITDDDVLAAVREVACGGVRRRTTHEVRRSEAEGGGILRFSVRPVRRDDAAAALIIIEDITQQRIADEARNAFVAQVTHELRTPLTNIRLYVEQAIEDGEKDAAVVAQALNIINQESRRLERIVGDMLSVSEIEAGSFKLRTAEVRLDALFEELEADYKPQAEAKQITMAFELPPKLPAITGDRDKIVLALHNLIGNAIKYTPEGGTVEVRVLVDETGDGKLVVDVVDSGIGINPEEADLIFDKFYRARDKRVSAITGTGLGLSLAREVVRLHGGDISVRSQPDRGSTFTMSMPTLAKAA